jgi:hypothetical protein
VAQHRYVMREWRSHFNTLLSFQHAHHLATLLSAQQAHFNIAAIFQQHFEMHFNISVDAHYYTFDDYHVHHCIVHCICSTCAVMQILLDSQAFTEFLCINVHCIASCIIYTINSLCCNAIHCSFHALYTCFSFVFCIIFMLFYIKSF